MAKQRKLTAGEIALARAAFADKIDYKKVRLNDGPGYQPLAHAAFAKGNPAITVGSVVYFKDRYSDDFSAPGQASGSFIHEMTHVWQYQAMSMPVFFARYGAEFVQAEGKPNDMYKYKEETDKFGEAMLEAQANMVQHYSEALWANNAAKKARIAKNLAESGVYGL